MYYSDETIWLVVQKHMFEHLLYLKICVNLGTVTNLSEDQYNNNDATTVVKMLHRALCCTVNAFSHVVFSTVQET